MLKELDLHVTNRCTSNCTYCCYSSNRLELEEMSFEKIKKVVSDAKKLGCEDVHITGGEPLLRQDIRSIIEYVSHLGIRVRLQTNGILFDEKMAKELKNCGLKSIMISLDSANEKTHDLARGKGSFKEVINAINLAIKWGYDLRVNSVITKLNYCEIFELIQFLNKIGVKKYSAFYFSPIGTGKAIVSEWIEPEKYYEFTKRLANQVSTCRELAGMDIVIEKGYTTWEEAKDLKIENFSGCGGGCINTYKKRNYLIVRCDGNVYPCIMAIDQETLGNVYEKSLGEIYKNSIGWEKLKLRNDPICQNCEHIKICSEGCRFYPRINDENVKHDPRCQIGELVPLCPIMKYNLTNKMMGGSSEDVMRRDYKENEI